MDTPNHAGGRGDHTEEARRGRRSICRWDWLVIAGIIVGGVLVGYGVGYALLYLPPFRILESAPATVWWWWIAYGRFTFGHIAVAAFVIAATILWLRCRAPDDTSAGRD